MAGPPDGCQCAFLSGNMEENIYMSLPGEYAHPQGLVCKLQKSIYGLKQARRAWNMKFTSDRRKSGFIPLVNAESVFTGVFFGGDSVPHFLCRRHCDPDDKPTRHESSQVHTRGPLPGQRHENIPWECSHAFRND
jgi:hypothetical protein